MAFTFTKTLSNADALRMAAAVGEFQTLGRSATGPEVDAFWTQFWKDFVKASEKRVAQAAVADAAPINPT